MTSDSFARPAHKPRPLIDLLASIVIPSVILMKFSGEADLGAARALLLALVESASTSGQARRRSKWSSPGLET